MIIIDTVLVDRNYGLNPYFTGLSILITSIRTDKGIRLSYSLNPYFTGLSILCLLYTSDAADE